MLFPDVSETVDKAQDKQKRSHNNSKKLRMFSVGEKVLAKHFRSSCPKWLAGEVVKVSSPLSYVIKLTNRTEVRCHVDYVRKREYVSESLDLSPDSQIEAEIYGGDFNSSSQTAVPIAVPLTDQPSSGRDVKTSETSTPVTSSMTRQSLRKKETATKLQTAYFILTVEECSTLILTNVCAMFIQCH